MQMIKLVETLLNLAISLAILSCANLVWLRLIWMNSILSMILVMGGDYVARTGIYHLFSCDKWRLREFLCISSDE